jgi:hypothetical protein
MPPLTPRQAVVALVESSAEFTGKKVWHVWPKLYDSFEAVTNTRWRVLAHNACQTTLDYLEEHEEIGMLMAYAQGYLSQDPKKKQPKEATT